MTNIKYSKRFKLRNGEYDERRNNYLINGR